MADDAMMLDGMGLPSHSSAVPPSSAIVSSYPPPSASPAAGPAPGMSPSGVANAPTIIWDTQNAFPLSNLTTMESDIITLLTPVTVHPDGNPQHTTDPFEPLGRALAEYHPMVRHVPYSKLGGITATHTAFIQRARVVIFVTTGLPAHEHEPSQLEYADIVRVLCGEGRPLIVVACFDFAPSDFIILQLPTVIHIPSYWPADLAAVATTMFTQRYAPPSPVASTYRPYIYPTNPLYLSESRGKTEVAPRRSRSPLFSRGITNTHTPSHNAAYPQIWDLATGDITPISALWEMCLPAQFCLSIKRLDSILRRPGYATHYIVRNLSGAIIGFCATFVNYLSHLTDDFSGCIAIIIVHPDYRRQGIGTMLHECAYNELENNPKVVRIQLGSTFPRLLHGIPWDTPHLRLWKGLCWEVDGSEPGNGAEVSDWLLDFDDLPDISLSSAGLTFEKCEPDDMIKVLDLVEQVILKKDHYGWYEQYAAHNEMLENIVVGMEGDNVVTAGLLYDPGSGTVSDRDLPWAESIGPETGGLTCICIADPESPTLVRPDAIMIRLLNTCVEILKKSGKTKLFIDGVRGGHLGFQSLGFRKWASYRECFHDIRERSPLKPIVSQVRAQMQAQAGAFQGKEEDVDQDML